MASKLEMSIVLEKKDRVSGDPAEFTDDEVRQVANDMAGLLGQWQALTGKKMSAEANYEVRVNLVEEEP